MTSEDKLLSVSPMKKRLGDLSDLKKQRGIVKGRLTNFKKYLDQFQDITPSEIQIKEIKFRMQACKDLFKTFNDIQGQIELLSPDSDICLNIEYVETLELIYFNSLAIAESLVECEKTGNNVGDSKYNCQSSRANIKLPEIKLPTFDGSYDHWLEYKNSYITMIHTRSDLDPIQKFHYLRSSLSGTALQVISALEFTASNYLHAWELLENRFHNTRLLVHNHLKSLFSITALKQESALQIRKLIDCVLRNLRALNTLQEPTDSWDTLIIYLIVSKLDVNTERDWEKHKGSLITNSCYKLKLDDLLTFLRNKADILEMIHANHSTSNNKSHSKPVGSETRSAQHKPNQSIHSCVVTNTTSTNNGSKNKSSNSSNKYSRSNCPSCNGKHPLYACYMFLNLTIKERNKFVEDKQICRNCLRSTHPLADCRFGPCQVCERKHNSLLHITGSDNNSCVRSENTTDNSVSHQASTSTALHSVTLKCESNTLKVGCAGADNIVEQGALQSVLLCTALVELIDKNNRVHTARALLDNGSQHSFITDKLRRQLNASTIQSTIHISGVAQSVTQSNESCDVIMRSRLCDYRTKVKCFVLQRITSRLPATNIDTQHIRIPNNIQLADPTYHIPSEIDLLIGSDLFWELLHDNRLRLINGPYLQNSKLGWLLAGPINSKNISVNNKIYCNFNQTLSDQLQRFWEIETVQQSGNVLTRDEQMCEELFVTTTKREADGRFSVRVPLKELPTALGDSYAMAKNRFLSLERKLERSSDYKRLYCDFMREYENLGHMTRVDKYDNINYFLPHHGVLRESSTTTKLRVVFNASAPTTSNKSLNDIQWPGPALQNDIFSILLRFRQYKYVACADVEKFFRQTLIQPDQRSLQLILWREKPVDPLYVYQLNTVTYGTASAPYLSMRCIRQLAKECEDEVVSRVITEDMFVDDLIFGSNSHEELLSMCERISKVLQSGCFSLRKWTFNAEATRSAPVDLFTGELTQNKTLGVGWQNDSDELYYVTKVGEQSNVTKLTKRIILSTISQIYDPLGLLSPIVIVAKILLQKLWLSKLDWDTPVPQDIAVMWNNFINKLQQLNQIKIPRYVLSSHDQYKELHIFTDSSQDAFGACAYIRTYSDDSECSVQLLCAKSKVAPLKSISIPRLELCGALVGARLYKKIVDSLRLEFTKTYFWTDSTIVIGWVRMSPHLLKTFVQNRVTEINELTGDSIWLHVASKDNPADLLSRGLSLDLLINNNLWWNGPSYLQSQDNTFNSNIQGHDDSQETINLPELKSKQVFNFVSTSGNVLIKFNDFSSFNEMKRVGAYALRFITYLHSLIVERRSGCSEVVQQQTGSLSVAELTASQRMLVRYSQKHSFPEIYDKLVNKLPLNVNSKENSRISGLNVFMDNHNIIRVGGRLSNSSTFDYNKKHPILLCSKHEFTILLVRHEHKRLLHAGPQLLLSTLRECWWPLSARNLVRKIVNECFICTRHKGKTLTPIMGNLPSSRLDPGFPFIRTGVDYAGPVLILNRKGRGSRLTKAYICLFVCFLTRAVHIELVTSLSADDYILALKRFISRRGKPTAIFSDNGRNFVGAEKEFKESLENNFQHIKDFAATDGIEFNFIPPYSPHFGGLWESGIRSCKHHIKRIIGNAHLTYEEFSTVLAQIEAVLNSRPLSPLSADPHDLTPLTPSHFFIGRPLTAPPVEDLTEVATSRLNRYRRIEQLRQHFWQRWSKEYVVELQQRTKWKGNKDDIALDSLVLIKEDGLPPLKWKLGRVLKVFPGTDGVSRVADIRTATGTIRRAFSKICPLPQQPEDNKSIDA